jgi:uncharacterized cupin superfamily protein
MDWFIRNLRDAQWFDGGRLGTYADFEGDEPFPQVAFNVGVCWPGQPNAMYHREADQEGFLVLSGECLLIVEGEERRLRAWDYFHCPAGVNHILVGAGDAPAFVIAVGAREHRRQDTVYPVDETALRHGAGVAHETREPAEAYAGLATPVPIPFDERLLPPIGPVSAPRNSG